MEGKGLLLVICTVHYPFLEPGTRLQLPGYPLPVPPELKYINYDLRGGEGVDDRVNNQRPLSQFHCITHGRKLTLQFCTFVNKAWRHFCAALAEFYCKKESEHRTVRRRTGGRRWRWVVL